MHGVTGCAWDRGMCTVHGVCIASWGVHSVTGVHGVTERAWYCGVCTVLLVCTVSRVCMVSRVCTVHGVCMVSWAVHGVVGCARCRGVCTVSRRVTGCHCVPSQGLSQHRGLVGASAPRAGLGGVSKSETGAEAPGGEGPEGCSLPCSHVRRGNIFPGKTLFLIRFGFTSEWFNGRAQGPSSVSIYVTKSADVAVYPRSAWGRAAETRLSRAGLVCWRPRNAGHSSE